MGNRGAGILMPILSLPSPYGIGDMGISAYEFIEFLKKANQRYWQVLPIGHTGLGNSPYQSCSSYAGNPYFISLDLLSNDGFLEKEDFIHQNWCRDFNSVDYKILQELRYKVLRKSYNNARPFLKHIKKYNIFIEKNAYWLNDYSLYMALKKYFDGKNYVNWDDEKIKNREPCSIKYYNDLLVEEIDFWKYIQYMFYNQWIKLKMYANARDIKIIGDIPIYVPLDSADVWANPRVFLLDKNNEPLFISACPPDYFSPEGQVWGTPVYNWEYLRNQNYKWWLNRLKFMGEIFDIVRIDHFIGLHTFYAIPCEQNSQLSGVFKQADGMKFIDSIKANLPNINIIAEDLGALNDEIRKFIKLSKYYGMKVLQFAFDTDESNPYLSHNYNNNSVVYTGTHDNNTIRGWLSELSANQISNLKKYVNFQGEKPSNWDLIKYAYESNANIAIIPMQDILNLPENCRMNTPGTICGNWEWRADKSIFSNHLAQQLKCLTNICNR